MPGECHGHIFMDGISYTEAVKRHAVSPDEHYIRSVLSTYQDRGVTFFRDGGDNLNVSAVTRQIAADYGIDYRTPVFAMHKKGYYGGIVGRAFSDISEYRKLIKTAKSLGCDFIKLMVSGILDYDCYGKLSCPSLPTEEIQSLIRIAHDEGFSIMIHVNEDAACRACIASGADTIEHGFFMSQTTLQLLAASHTIWVPTLSPSFAAIGSGRFPDEVLRKITESQMENIRYAHKLGCTIAAGSDAGAYKVPHGEGIEMEYGLLRKCGLADDDLRNAELAIQYHFLNSCF